MAPDTSPRFLSFGVETPEPASQIQAQSGLPNKSFYKLKDSLLEVLAELTYRMQNSNCKGRLGIESLPSVVSERELKF